MHKNYVFNLKKQQILGCLWFCPYIFLGQLHFFELRIRYWSLWLDPVYLSQSVIHPEICCDNTKSFV